MTLTIFYFAYTGFNNKEHMQTLHKVFISALFKHRFAYIDTCLRLCSDIFTSWSRARLCGTSPPWHCAWKNRSTAEQWQNSSMIDCLSKFNTFRISSSQFSLFSAYLLSIWLPRYQSLLYVSSFPNLRLELHRATFADILSVRKQFEKLIIYLFEYLMPNLPNNPVTLGKFMRGLFDKLPRNRIELYIIFCGTVGIYSGASLFFEICLLLMSTHSHTHNHTLTETWWYGEFHGSESRPRD